MLHHFITSPECLIFTRYKASKTKDKNNNDEKNEIFSQQIIMPINLSLKRYNATSLDIHSINIQVLTALFFTHGLALMVKKWVACRPSTSLCSTNCPSIIIEHLLTSKSIDAIHNREQNCFGIYIRLYILRGSIFYKRASFAPSIHFTSFQSKLTAAGRGQSSLSLCGANSGLSAWTFPHLIIAYPILWHKSDMPIEPNASHWTSTSCLRAISQPEGGQTRSQCTCQLFRTWLPNHESNSNLLKTVEINDALTERGFMGNNGEKTLYAFRTNRALPCSHTLHLNFMMIHIMLKCAQMCYIDLSVMCFPSHLPNIESLNEINFNCKLPR